MPYLGGYDQEYLWRNGIFPKNAIGLELGIFRGDLAKNVIRELTPKMYYMIDPWKHHPGWKKKKYKGKYIVDQDFVEWMFQDICKEFDKPNVRIYRGFSYELVNEFEDEYFDFIYVDASHKYKDLLRDLTLYYPKLKDGGLMSGDDWLLEEGKNGVKEAVLEFTSKIGVVPTRRKCQYWWRKKRKGQE